MIAAEECAYGASDCNIQHAALRGLYPCLVREGEGKLRGYLVALACRLVAIARQLAGMT
jgi:hypothetical protein